MKNIRKIFIIAALILSLLVIFTVDVFAYTTDTIFVNEFNELMKLEPTVFPDLAPKGTGDITSPRVVYTTEDFLEAMAEGSYTFITLSDNGKTKGNDEYILHDIGNKLVEYGASPGIKVLKIEGKHKFLRDTDEVLPFITVNGDTLRITGDEDSALIYECTADKGQAHYMFDVVNSAVLSVEGEISLLTMQDEFKNASGAYASGIARVYYGGVAVKDAPVLYGTASSDGYCSNALVVGHLTGDFETAGAYAEISGGRFVTMRYDETSSVWNLDNITGRAIHLNEKPNDLVTMEISGGIFTSEAASQDSSAKTDDYVLMGHDVHRYGENIIAVTMDCMGFVNMYPEYDYLSEKTDADAYSDEILEFTFNAKMSDVEDEGYTRIVSAAVFYGDDPMPVTEKTYSSEEQKYPMSFLFDGTDRDKYEIGEFYDVVLSTSLFDPYDNFVGSEQYKYHVKVQPSGKISYITFEEVQIPISGEAANAPQYLITSDRSKYYVMESGWYDEEGNFFNGSFEKGKIYKPYVILGALSGESFADEYNMTVHVNGDEAYSKSVTAYGQICEIIFSAYKAKDAAPGNYIGEVAIEEMYAPIAGRFPNTGMESIITSDTTHYVVGAAGWLDENGNEFLGQFEAGKKYSEFYKLIANENASFLNEDAMNVTINGEKTMDVQVLDTADGNNSVCIIKKEFTAVSELLIEYITIEDMYIPSAGADASHKPLFVVSYPVDRYEIVETYWTDVHGGGFTGIFEEGSTYMAFARFKAGHGVNFANTYDIEVTVNGEKAEAQTSLYGDECIVKLAEFAIEKIETIKELTVLNVVEPKIGESAMANPMFEMKMPVIGYGFEKAYWTDENGSIFTGTFEAGKTYRAYLVLGVSSGYEFADNANMTITVAGKPTEFNVDTVSKECTILLGEFELKIPVTTITEVNIKNVIIPEKGDTATSPVYEFSVTPVGFKDGGTYWTDENDSIFTGTFEEGKKYKAHLVVDTLDGFVFADTPGITVTVNGQPVSFSRSSDGKHLNVIIIDVTIEKEETYLLGDVNKDGKINALDATQILRYANNKSSVISSMSAEEAKGRADVNKDGKINALDATQILRYANNKPSVI